MKDAKDNMGLRSHTGERYPILQSRRVQEVSLPVLGLRELQGPVRGSHQPRTAVKGAEQGEGYYTE